MHIKKLIIFIFIVIVAGTFIYAGNYNEGLYDSGVYGTGQVATSTEETSAGTSGGPVAYRCYKDSDCKINQYCSYHNCYDAECFEDYSCNVKEGESCFNHQCVKLFDMEIVDFKSPAEVEGFFNFTYFIKAVAEINGDVEVNFWIQDKNNSILTSGKDTFYMGSYEEKTKTKKLFLPKEISSGTYKFYIEVNYENYTANAYRTISIDVKNGLAKINLMNFKQYVTYSLIGIGVILVIFIFCLDKKIIKQGLIKKWKWFKKHKKIIFISLSLILLAVLIYYFKWYELIINLVKKLWNCLYNLLNKN